MKRMSTIEINLEAKRISDLWLGRYGARNANKISLAVRRLFRVKKGN